ncbi:hypothetical protein FIBSPDRAFT_479348 [Athelia psychrophila]|uniref:Uncharacterized protein n=1 Tax=Athelia psychrophila TaxID=1759441 RepID=A0A166VCI9_9AGAM|nr:hypothetical protein FIBSPDRAFT_479348 [Fibularhizoctonia sp. CBS 109695]
MMRQISDARRHHALSLSERLKEIASVRLKLLAELDDLDAQARAVLLERNILHNLDAPTSDIPDELLVMLFEADEDMHLSQGLEPHFGALVSHVSHRWREIALATPTLWSRVRFVVGKRKSLEQFYLYLSRSKLAPVDIYIDLRQMRLRQDLLQAIANHMGHCRRLCIENVERESLQRFLECTSHQPAPVLAFLKIGAFLNIESSNLAPYSFSGPLFASAAPRLRILHMNALELNTIQIPYLFAFKAVTCLRLGNMSITSSEAYSTFRYILGEIRSLSHLELRPVEFPIPLPPQPPLELPNLRFLHVDFLDCPQTLNIVIQNIRASSLTSLSLDGRHGEGEALDPDVMRLARSHFPFLRHLIISGGFQDIYLLAETFPDIERLAFKTRPFGDGKNIHVVLAEIDQGTTLAWPKLESIAIDRMYSHAVDLALRNAIIKLQQAGRPLRMLMLPRDTISKTDTKALAQLRKVVEIEPFRDDWPKPFENVF